MHARAFLEPGVPTIPVFGDADVSAHARARRKCECHDSLVIESIRQVVRSVFPAAIDQVVASAFAMLTVVYLALGDDSPLDTVARATRWLGVDVTSELEQADVWLNASHRHDFFMWTCLALLGAMLAVSARRLATASREYEASLSMDLRRAAKGLPTVQEHRRWGLLQDYRFWAVAWILTGVLAQLGEISWGRLTAGGVAVLVWLAAWAGIDDFRRSSRVAGDKGREAEPLGWAAEAVALGAWTAANNAIRAVSVMVALPRELWEFIAYARLTHEGPRSDSDAESHGT